MTDKKDDKREVQKDPKKPAVTDNPAKDVVPGDPRENKPENEEEAKVADPAGVLDPDVKKKK